MLGKAEVVRSLCESIPEVLLRKHCCEVPEGHVAEMAKVGFVLYCIVSYPIVFYCLIMLSSTQ